MRESDKIKDKMLVTEVDLALAKIAGKEALILMYGNNLVELRKEMNRHLTGEGRMMSVYPDTYFKLFHLRRLLIRNNIARICLPTFVVIRSCQCFLTTFLFLIPNI